MRDGLPAAGPARNDALENGWRRLVHLDEHDLVVCVDNCPIGLARRVQGPVDSAIGETQRANGGVLGIITATDDEHGTDHKDGRADHHGAFQ